ncbi:hypothetical protein ACKKBF_B03855 [Auxenochlorella protothecoides x Auxenochlorella symbiontica]
MPIHTSFLGARPCTRSSLVRFRPVWSRARRGPTGRVFCASPERFDLASFHEAVVGEVLATDETGGVVILRIKDERKSILKVFIGRAEADSMRHARGELQLPRPNTHDAMAELIRVLKCRVTKVCITEIRGMTYYARLYMIPSGNAATEKSKLQEIVMDMRPSDAVSVAIRVGAPLYVDKDVAKQMGRPASGPEPLPSNESHAQIVRSCREEAAKFVDPTTLYSLQLALAVAEERFADAAKLQGVIAEGYAQHPGARALVAMQAALQDGRFEEAARHRDELRRVRLIEFQASAVGVDPWEQRNQRRTETDAL